MDKKGITEATIFMIIALILGIIVIILYFIFVGPSTFVNAITSFFSKIGSTIFGSFTF